MSKFILFYNANCDNERHMFDNLSGEELLKAIADTYKSEISNRLYDFTDIHGIEEFMEDYNDEYLDGGFWCFTFEADKEKLYNLIKG